MQFKHILIVIILFFPFCIKGNFPETLSGKIIDGNTGLSIEGASVVIENINTGTFSNVEGEYILYLGNGKYSIHLSAPGYIEKKINISVSENMVANLSLEPEKKCKKKLNKFNSLFRDNLPNESIEVLSDNIKVEQ
jgi:hypothetical protein